MYPIKFVSLYVFMKLTTRSRNVAFIGYYEFYSGLQTTVQFSLYCDIFLELRVCSCQFVNVDTVPPLQF
jgi:hypothetical protein